MLKLTDSFYRYLWLTCKHILSRKDHLNICSLLCHRRLSPLAQSERYLASKKKIFAYVPKKSRLKIPPMSDPLHPTLSHVSYGGQFEISDADGAHASTDQWRRRDPSHSAGRQMQRIPENFRVWEAAGHRETMCDGIFQFRLVSYNVLAQYLLECHSYLYRECHPNNLSWRVRSERLFDEIMQLAPDILCLQEVQASQLTTFYDQFEKAGYLGLFKRKTGLRSDGCAIYFKQSLFKIIEHMTVEFYQPQLPILNRHNIGIMAKLVPRCSTASPFVVATTHLLFNPKRNDVRLAQMQLFLAEIDRFAYYHNGRESGHLPIILTGDLNSEITSSVVELLERARACSIDTSSDWREIEVTDNCQHLSVLISRQRGERCADFSKTKIHNTDYGTNAPENILRAEHARLFNSRVLRHSLKLISVYEHIKPSGEHEATTFQDNWLTVDYIYFSKCSRLNLFERLRLPTTSECRVLGSLPNDRYASDHLVLAAKFELRLNKNSL